MRGRKLGGFVSAQHGRLRRQQEKVTFQQVRHADPAPLVITDKVCKVYNKSATNLFT